MIINEEVIPHHNVKTIPIHKLKEMVCLNEAYLKEKSTWYMIDGKLQYFKIRNDFRLFTEQFYAIFAKQVLDLDTVNYQVSTISIEDFDSKTPKIRGLLSDNFQKPNYNYYLISELMKDGITNLISYGNYSLKNLLNFFQDSLTKENYDANLLFLIKSFIGDGFTFQKDRNYHNICFETPAIEGINYKKRLHPNVLVNNPKAVPFYEKNNDGVIFLKDLNPSILYDNERILGVDHKDVLSYNHQEVWRPLFPYTSDLVFKSAKEAKSFSKKVYDGLDPNLMALYMDYEKLCKPYFERLAYDDEYRKILENFTHSNSPMILTPQEIEYIQMILEERREAFSRILKY